MSNATSFITPYDVRKVDASSACTVNAAARRDYDYEAAQESSEIAEAYCLDAPSAIPGGGVFRGRIFDRPFPIYITRR